VDVIGSLYPDEFEGSIPLVVGQSSDIPAYGSWTESMTVIGLASLTHFFNWSHIHIDYKVKTL
jgi:hypothetical protein